MAIPTDEFCNDPGEIHALVAGAYAGLTEWKGADVPDEFVAEKHYYQGGYIVGTILRWVGLVVVGGIGGGVALGVI